jgi:glycolate oxidase
MLQAIDKISTEHGVRIATIAHAGDGNLHPLIITPADDEQAHKAAQAAFEDILDRCIALGGTVTGEHGVGLLKRNGMRQEMDPGALAMQKAVKAALDPLDLFNPGKIFGDPAKSMDP